LAVGSWLLAKSTSEPLTAKAVEDDLRKPEKTTAEMTGFVIEYAISWMHKGQKKLCHIFRYSARTRVIVEENSVRIVQRMKNPAARKAASSFELLAPSRTRNQNPNLLNHEGHEGKQEQARIKAYILKNAHLSAHLFILSRRSKPLSWLSPPL